MTPVPPPAAPRRGPGRSVDPLTVMIVAVLLAGLLLPARGRLLHGFSLASSTAVVLLFFLYGVRTSRAELHDALRAWRLQTSVLVATFVVFPLLGALAQATPWLAADLRTGVLYLSLLPSTVQSSIVFTSIARGNVPGAITAATASNVFGIVLTPALVALVMGRTGGALGPDALVGTLTQLLLPFAVGQVLQRWLAPWVTARPVLTRVTDRGTIVLVVYVSVSEATVSGAWGRISVAQLLVLVAVCAALLGAMLTLTWRGGALLRLDRPDRIALLMCGSKKSLATGLPMASVLFAPATAAAVALPVIVFHQLQLATCAVIARRLSRQPVE